MSFGQTRKVYKMMRPDFGLAIETMKQTQSNALHNAPINEREGNLKRAKIERDTANSIKAVFAKLREK